MSQALVMVFQEAEGKKRQIRVDDPRMDLTEEEVVQAMNTIITKNIFGGAALVSPDSAQLITTEVSEIDITQQP